MSEGIVTFVSSKGWFFAEHSEDHSSVFIHQKSVENGRYLRVGDRVSFEVVPSIKHPGNTMAANVKFLGHIITRQVSGNDGAR
jgi:cold shock CspA family protein